MSKLKIKFHLSLRINDLVPSISNSGLEETQLNHAWTRHENCQKYLPNQKHLLNDRYYDRVLCKIL